MQGLRASKLLSAAITRTAPKRTYIGHQKLNTYNDMPSPQGNWKTHYDAQQRKYNAHLIFGIAFTLGTVVFARATGCLDLNYMPPRTPGPKRTY